MSTLIGKLHSIAIWIMAANLLSSPRASGVPEHWFWRPRLRSNYVTSDWGTFYVSLGGELRCATPGGGNQRIAGDIAFPKIRRWRDYGVVAKNNRLLYVPFHGDEIRVTKRCGSRVLAFQQWKKDDWIAGTEFALWQIDGTSGDVKKIAGYPHPARHPRLSIYEKGEDSLLYVFGLPNGILCFDLDGDLVWRVPGWGGDGGVIPAGSLHVCPDGSVIAVWQCGVARRVGIGGKLIWKRDLELGGAWLTGSGVVVGNQLVVAAYFGTIMKRMVIAIDIDNGDLLWQRTLDKEPMCGPIADPAQKHLIVVTKDTSILVLDLQGNIQEVHEKVGCVGEPLVTEKGIVFAGKFGGLSTIKSVAK